MPEPEPIERTVPPEWIVLLATLALHLWASRTFLSFTWPDEVFQVLEQAHRLAFGEGIVPWEFRDGIRSFALPGAFAAVMKVSAPFGQGSFGYLFGVQLAMAACSLAPVAAAMAWARRQQAPMPWVAGAACAVWFELVFFSGKALTEVFAAYALVPALLWTDEAGRRGERRVLLWAGAAVGLAVGLRFHLLPVAGLCLVWAGRASLRRWGWVALGFVGVLACFGLLDWLTWGTPWQSIWKNLWVNLVEKKAEFFGVSAWHEYLGSLRDVWGWSAVPLLGLFAYGAYRAPLLGLSAALILVSHSAIAHKEYRFLAPMLAVVAVTAGLGLAHSFRRGPSLGAALAGLFLVASAHGAWRYDWKDLAPRETAQPAGNLWTYRAGLLHSYRALSADPQLCGLGLLGMHWAWTGGYTYLHQPVPMFPIRSGAELTRLLPHFNVAVGPEHHGEAVGPLLRARCWDGVCLYRREGECSPKPGYHINQHLAARGE
jgi:GPI mannosyltransferase 3